MEGKKAPSVWEVDEFTTNEKRWSEKGGGEKLTFVLIQCLKTILMLCLLYLFIVSLSLMANSFRILGGKASGRAFRDTELFDNPIAGLVAGILVTVLVQSSSTSTSIIISMTAGGLIETKNAIPMIMGANIGTSVTNTIVSLGHMGNKNEYRRAFAGATVHDMFNFLNVCVFLPIEFITGLLRHLATAIVDGFDITDDEEKEASTEILQAIVKPVNNRILAIDKKLIQTIAEADSSDLDKYDEQSIIKHKQKDDNHMFMDTPMSDGVAGVLMVLVSLGFLTLSLILMVKVLQSIFRGRIAIFTRRMVNLEIDAVPGLANYILIVGGALLTLVFQSSSVTTSTLTPLVGIGLIRIEKMFAFTVGANIGTCVTGILSALVTDKRKTGLIVALSHLLFNVLGALLWYPIPLVRNIPLGLARVNGNLAADKAWWPCFYIVVVFLGLPLLLLGISAVSPWLLLALGIPFLALLFGAIAVLTLRSKAPEKLPLFFQRDPKWLPNSLRINKDEEASGDGLTVNVAASSADIGAGDWQAAPVAWGGGWLILFALLVALTNAKWADIKYPSFDKRDHIGFSAWKACNYGYYDSDMVWATPYDPTNCDNTYLEACATDASKTSMGDCTKVSFSNIPDINQEYENSWMNCRARCPMFKWLNWCESRACAGTFHKMQCQNVTEAVMRPYVVTYGPSGGFGLTDKAWTKGDRCRNLEDVCDNSKSMKVVGDVGCVGLVFAFLGHVAVMIYNFQYKKRDVKMVLVFALANWLLMWIFSFVSWLHYVTVSEEKTTCMVEDVSGTGAVLATGAFKDIAGGSYTFGYMVGSWVLSLGVIIAISARLLNAQPFVPKGPTESESPVVEKGELALDSI